jgi:hypothetical protein
MHIDKLMEILIVISMVGECSITGPLLNEERK